MKGILIFLSLLVVVRAAWYDRNGVMTPGTAIPASGTDMTLVTFSTNSPRPWNGTFFITGFGDGGSCACSLIKSWEGATPPANLDATLITSGRCLNDFNSDLSKGKIVKNYPIDYTDANGAHGSVVLNSYKQIGTRNAIKADIKTINFAIIDMMDFGIIQIDRKAIDMFNEGYHFYNIASENLQPGTSVINIGFWDSSFLAYFMQMMRGTVVANRNYQPKYGNALTYTFQHTTNVYSTGAPIFNTLDNSTIYGIVGEGQTTANYATHISTLKTCFKPTGEFTMNAPNCLNQFKLDYMAKYNESVDGVRYLPKDNVTSNTSGIENYDDFFMESLDLQKQEHEFEHFGIAYGSAASTSISLLFLISISLISFFL